MDKADIAILISLASMIASGERLAGFIEGANEIHSMLKASSAEKNVLKSEVADLRKQRDELLAALKGIRDLFYGQGLEVSGWHQNGDHESMDAFFDNNGWLDAIARAEGRK